MDVSMCVYPFPKVNGAAPALRCQVCVPGPALVDAAPDTDVQLPDPGNYPWNDSWAGQVVITHDVRLRKTVITQKESSRGC